MAAAFFFNATATTEIYTLSLHDALPILELIRAKNNPSSASASAFPITGLALPMRTRSEEHTSELQSQSNLVCRLLLEKKKITGPAGPPVVDREGRCADFRAVFSRVP